MTALVSPVELSAMTYSILTDTSNRPYHFRFSWSCRNDLDKPVVSYLNTSELNDTAPSVSIAAAFDHSHEDYPYYYYGALTLEDTNVAAEHVAILSSRNYLATKRAQSFGIVVTALALETYSPGRNIQNLWSAMHLFKQEVRPSYYA